MIGSFWNLCRACPSMPVDKLHSEYRSTYRWHEYTGPRQEVVRRPPQSSTAAPPVTGERNNIQNTTLVHEEEVQNELPKLEPALPRRKKHPELAYRHHEFLASSRDNSLDVSESANNDRARGRETGLLRKAISKLSTEYRLQFAWPHGHISRRDKVDSTPRKSLSMGAIKPTANAMVHRKRIDLENKDASELEPLVNDNPVHEDSKEDKVQISKEFKTEYKKQFRPFSQYEYSEGRFTDRGNENKILIENSNPNIIPINATESWYREVVELRKKAGQYKHRGWGTELAPERLSELYNKQTELWDQVSQRSSLSALSLASTTHRSYTKEEKEQENNKRSSPTKPLKNPDNSIRGVKDMIRHHLERTTGGSELDGLILSPTREKLEPTIPRKDEDYRGSQKGSPQKYSPQKGSPQKSAIQKRNSQKVKNALKAVRSQSVGPTDTITEKRSPKRQSRSATVKEKRSSSNSTSATRRPRPSAEQPTAVDKSESIEAPIVTEPDAVDLEPVVKSPPEPTRVKSPEQILMRSPDPVNWTVPLDTGKTFTVTQNIREGDIGTRPHSEIKAWTPPEVPPPAAQSAPPQFSEQTKEQGMSMS
uniref:Nuclear protein MDM1 n=1 Tax=Photinus pyralis TaxID=7054 RepID=A0A1Y1LRM8_PHOPY